jgi:hypothetical protein
MDPSSADPELFCFRSGPALTSRLFSAPDLGPAAAYVLLNVHLSAEIYLLLFLEFCPNRIKIRGSKNMSTIVKLIYIET